MILPLFAPIDNINTIINQLSHNPNDPNKLFLPHTKNSIINAATKTAIYNFLSEYKDSNETLKSYVKELERLILWCEFTNKIDILTLENSTFNCFSITEW